MHDLIRRISHKIIDEKIPLSVVARRIATAARGVLTAPVHLRSVQRVGRFVRTVGAPHIENLGRMEIGDRVNLRSTIVPIELTTAPGALLVLGDDAFLNYGVSIGATGEIRIGARVAVGPYVMIIDTVFHDLHDRRRAPPPAAVVVEDDVFLGAKCSIMPGVRVGRGAVVATGSVVTKDVEPFTIVAGMPARLIGRIDETRFVSGEVT